MKSFQGERIAEIKFFGMPYVRDFAACGAYGKRCRRGCRFAADAPGDCGHPPGAARKSPRNGLFRRRPHSLPRRPAAFFAPGAAERRRRATLLESGAPQGLRHRGSCASEPRPPQRSPISRRCRSSPDRRWAERSFAASSARETPMFGRRRLNAVKPRPEPTSRGEGAKVAPKKSRVGGAAAGTKTGARRRAVSPDLKNQPPAASALNRRW